MNTRCLSLVTLSLLLLLRAEASHGRGTEQEMMEALDESKQEGDTWKYAPLSGPHFDSQHSKNVSSQIGKTSVLNCRVKYAGGKTISWIRGRDLHLLTVGRFTYTSDDRFKAVHQSGSEDWLLKIHYVQLRDQGPYECQVSTTPPLAHTVYLTVVAEPETKILGGPDIYINSGSTINLTCVVRHSPTPPSFILWYKNKQLLSYDAPRGGITLVTEHGPTSTSRLLIQKATLSDAGKYVCKPSNMDEHSALIHVIHNEHPAAIHHINGTSTASTSTVMKLLSSSFIYITLLATLLLWLQRRPVPMNSFPEVGGNSSLNKNYSKLKQVASKSEKITLSKFDKKVVFSRCLLSRSAPLSGKGGSKKLIHLNIKLGGVTSPNCSNKIDLIETLRENTTNNFDFYRNSLSRLESVRPKS